MDAKNDEGPEPQRQGQKSPSPSWRRDDIWDNVAEKMP